MNIIAVDPSLRQTGIYNSVTDQTTIIKTSETENFALYKIFETINAFYKQHKPQIVIVERPSFNSFGNGVTKLAAVNGIIKIMAMHQGARVVEMSPMTWKSSVFGKDRKQWPKKAKKSEYLKAVKTQTGRSFKTTDEADAYMIFTTYMKTDLKGKFVG